jgi:hypothetical protein
MTSAPKVGATEIYVVSYHDGRLQAFTRRPGFAERAGSRYCYIIDTSEQRTAWTFTAPSRQDAYRFTINADITWQANDAESLVRSGTQDPVQVIRTSVEDEIWYIAEGFQPHDALGAGQACRKAAAAMGNRPAGLVVTRAAVRVTTDRSLTDGNRQVGVAQHQGVLSKIAMEQETARVYHLKSLLQGDDAVLLLHLANNREDTGQVLQLLIEGRHRGEVTRLELFDRMVEKGFIQDSDVQGLRDSLLGAMWPGAGQQIGVGNSPPQLAIGAGNAPQPVVYSGQSSGSGDLPRDSLRPAPDANPPRQAGGVRTWKPLPKRDSS